MMQLGKSFITLILLVAAARPLAAEPDSSAGAARVQTGRDIWVQPDEKAGDVTCFVCSIHVRGAVTGDVFALGGRIVVEQGGAIDGDIATIAGDIVVENGASVGGDAAAIGGSVRRLPQGVIGGDVDSLGVAWLVVIVVVPLLVLGALVAFIIWLARRSKQRTPVPTVVRGQ